MTDVTKKAVRLEDKLAVACSELAVAKAALAAAEAEIADELRDAKKAEHTADQYAVAANRWSEDAKTEACSRLGLTPGKARRAVLTWAGLRPGEDGEATIRGENKILDDAIARLVSAVLARDQKVISANNALQASYEARKAPTERVRKLEASTHEEDRRVSSLEHDVRELNEKIDERDRRKAAQSPAKKKEVSKEDQARFIEARRRLTEVAKTFSHWGDHRKLKIDPPFVWPPKES